MAQELQCESVYCPQITVADVENVLEVGQARFGDAPLVWLKNCSVKVFIVHR